MIFLKYNSNNNNNNSNNNDDDFQEVKYIHLKQVIARIPFKKAIKDCILNLAHTVENAFQLEK